MIHQLSEIKINKTYEYFMEINLKLKDENIRFIVFHWKNWLKRLRDERLRELTRADEIRKQKTVSTKNLTP